MTCFDLMDKFLRLTLGRNQIEPTPGYHQALRQSQNAVGNRIAVVVIVKEPGINIALAQRSLNSSKVHGQVFILNYLVGLREDAGIQQLREDLDASVGATFDGRGLSGTP